MIAIEVIFPFRKGKKKKERNKHFSRIENKSDDGTMTIKNVEGKGADSRSAWIYDLMIFLQRKRKFSIFFSSSVKSEMVEILIVKYYCEIVF